MIVMHYAIHNRGDTGISVRGNILGGGGRPSRKVVGEFSKIAKDFLRKLQKFIILVYFSKIFKNPAWIFRAFERNTQIVGKIWEDFERFDESSIEN